MADQENAAELNSIAQLGDVVAGGESERGGYNAYNTGTRHNRVVHSGVKPLYAMTVNQILDSSRLPPENYGRVFAAGKYQVITNTLRLAKAEMGLSGNELFTPELQERIFLHYLIGKKRPKIGAYITRGEGTSTTATYECAKEWASVEVPAGLPIQSGRSSNGHVSYYESGANHAKRGSGARVKAALEHAHAVFAAVQRGENPQEPERLPAMIGDEDETPDTGAGGTVGAQAGGAVGGGLGAGASREGAGRAGGGAQEGAGQQDPDQRANGRLITGSVGAGGANHEPDIGAVQQALHDHGHSPGLVDHIMGQQTIRAIRSFQASFMKHPDGLVEPGKITEQHLMDASTNRALDEAPGIEDPRDQQMEHDLDDDPIGASSRAARRDTEAETPQQPSQAAPATDGDLAALMQEARLSPEQIARARAMIAREPRANRPALYRQLQEKVVYANQRDNQATFRGRRIETGHGEMCNLTSLAMCLQYLGIPNPHPEMQYEDALERVRQEHGFRARTTPDGWSSVARAVGAHVEMLAWAATHDRGWWKKVVGAQVSAGHSVMCSITGHIVRIQSVEEEGLVVDDPYGKTRLGSGTRRRFTQTNARNRGGNVGEDNTWTWDQVERHSFLWVAAFSR